MNNNIKNTCLALLCASCILLAACNKGSGDSTGGTQTAGKEQEVNTPMEVPAQQQTKPVAPDSRQIEEQKKARGSNTELPANWPQMLSLPEGATISRSVSQDGQDVVEFTSARPLLELAAELSASASASGFKLKQASVDKYQLVRNYLGETRQLVCSLTDFDGNISGSMVLSEIQPGQYFSESTHYTGEFSLPAAWPSDILPVYTGAVLREMHVPLNTGGRLMLSCQSADAEDAVIAWLEQDLPARGWTVTNSFTRNGFSIRELTGNGFKLTVAARGNEGLTDIQYDANPI
jgi:hypothetical protein